MPTRVRKTSAKNTRDSPAPPTRSDPRRIKKSGLPAQTPSDTDDELPLVKSGSSLSVTPPEHTLKEILSDRWLRLTNLYYTKNKYGEKVKFAPWPEQAELLADMHTLNVILKARQRGITTAIQIYWLDACLFNNDVNAGVIAHNREDASKFFDDKIKYAYDHLPEAIKMAIPSRSDNSNELSFANGSSIRVGTSMRSGTLQYLHISEYGKICAKYPEKAQEIRAGSLNTVAPGSVVMIESTAEGAHGHFYQTCQTAEKLQLAGKQLTTLDYRFFFFPWWRAPEYVLDQRVDLTRENIDYFTELKDEYGIVLTRPQMNWYVKKQEEQGEVMMTQEYPSTPAESFQGIVDGAVFGKQMRLVRKERRIMKIPVIDTAPVNTFWDIGHDMTSIWFHQRVGPQNRFIDYHQAPNESLSHFARLLLQDRNERFHEYNYGTHYFPHDMNEEDYSVSDNQTRAEIARTLGLKPNRVVPRIANIADGIEMTRQSLASCYFDEKRCDTGIKGLEGYRYEYNEKHEIYTSKPLHNWASHPADSFRQFAQGYRYSPYLPGERPEDNPLSRAYRRKARADKSDWRV